MLHPIFEQILSEFAAKMEHTPDNPMARGAAADYEAQHPEIPVALTVQAEIDQMLRPDDVSCWIASNCYGVPPLPHFPDSRQDMATLTVAQLVCLLLGGPESNLRRVRHELRERYLKAHANDIKARALAALDRQ